MGIQEFEELTCRRGIDRVQAFSPLLLHGHEAALPEAPQMVRSRSLAQATPPHNLRYVQWPLQKLEHDLKPLGTTESFEEFPVRR